MTLFQIVVAKFAAQNIEAFGEISLKFRII